MRRSLIAAPILAVAGLSVSSATATPPVIWHVNGAVVETQGTGPEVIQHGQREETGASFSWNQRLDWTQNVTTGELSGFTEQRVEIATRGGTPSSSTLNAGQYQEWEYVHAGGWASFAFSGWNQLVIEAYVLGAPGTACRFEMNSSTTTPRNPATPSQLDVVGWATPGYAFEWGNQGGTYSLDVQSTGPVVQYEGREYSRVWIRPTSDLLDVYSTTGPWRSPYVVSGGLRHELQVTVTNNGLCRADVDQDGAVNSQDFFAFLNAFFNGAGDADFNTDGAVNTQDVFDFMSAFFGGC